MANRKAMVTANPEIAAIGLVHDALKDLEATAQRRVLEYVAGVFGLRSVLVEEETVKSPDSQSFNAPSNAADVQKNEESEGISPVALKWMKRTDLTVSALSSLFSIGGDEIDLVAKKVPGANKKDRMHSVLLLKGIAAYLSTGAARMTHEQVKEACLHYDAFDTANFASYLKSFGAEVAGTKESGYTLTARGLTNATDIIKSIVVPKSGV